MIQQTKVKVYDPAWAVDHSLELIEKALIDPYFPGEAEVLLRSQLEDAWDHQLGIAEREIAKLNTKYYYQAPSRQEIEEVLATLDRCLSGNAFTSHLRARPWLQEAFAAGGRHVEAQYTQQTGKSPQKKSVASFGLLFGLTDDHAVLALENQLILSAGGFWDNDLSNTIRREMLAWFDGVETTNAYGTTAPMSRHELVGNLKRIVNPARDAAGKTNKAGISAMSNHYFRGLAENLIVRARNIGSFYKANELGAKTYVIKNPLDSRTSGVCRQLANSGTEFPIGEANDTVQAIITSSSLEELKSRAPFLTTTADAVGPVPPLHWLCRSWMEYRFR